MSKVNINDQVLFKIYDGELISCPQCGESEGEWEEMLGDWCRCANCGTLRQYPSSSKFRNLYNNVA